MKKVQLDCGTTLHKDTCYHQIVFGTGSGPFLKPLQHMLHTDLNCVIANSPRFCANVPLFSIQQIQSIIVQYMHSERND